MILTPATTPRPYAHRAPSAVSLHRGQTETYEAPCPCGCAVVTWHATRLFHMVGKCERDDGVDYEIDCAHGRVAA